MVLLFIKYLYDWKRNTEPHDNRSLFTICKPALSQLIFGAWKEIDTCNYFAVELSRESIKNCDLLENRECLEAAVFGLKYRARITHSACNVAFVVYIF